MYHPKLLYLQCFVPVSEVFFDFSLTPSNASLLLIVFQKFISVPSLTPSIILHHECLTPPIVAPLTCSQSILSSSSSSTRPTKATLSPLIKYSPCGTSLDGSGLSGGWMMRSVVCDSTFCNQHLFSGLVGKRRTHEVRHLIA